MTVIGIDFGTSNCAAHVATDNGEIIAIPLEGDELLLPSVVFSARREVAVRQIESNEFARRLKSAKTEQTNLAKEGATLVSERVLRANIETAMRREAAQEADKKYWDQTFFSTTKDGQASIFGTPALRAYITDPLSGTLVRSPKSFLGSSLEPIHLAHFEYVVADMLSHIKRKAEKAVGAPITKTVIGRPVNYHGDRGEHGNNQAIKVMKMAAKTAGFSQIEFFPEPLAAALEFEKTIQRETLVLVVDVGGGTTDCAIVRIGPKCAGKRNRSLDVLGYAGDRIGGTDFDQALAWQVFMPLLGKDSLTRSGRPLPHSILFDAISTRSVPAQLRFRAAAHKIERLIKESTEPDLLNRFLILHQKQLQYRLINSSELTKIKLSESQSCTVPLHYFEEGLNVSVSLKTFEISVQECLGKIEKITAEALKTAGQKPDTVFVTGGMGFSPVVVDTLRKVLGHTATLVSGDMLGTVSKGLGEYARLLQRVE